MNKKILAAAIAASMAAPMAVAADVTIYGIANASVVASDVPNGGQDVTDVVDNGSRLGFKGSEDLGNGMKANFQLELSVDWTDETAAPLATGRNTFVGVSGDFGEFRIGRHDTPAKMAAISLSTFGDQLGDVNQVANIQNVRSGDAIAYISPNMSGFKVAAAVITGSQSADATKRDEWAAAYSFGAFYDNGGLSVRAYYEDRDDLQNPANRVTATISNPLVINTALSTTTNIANNVNTSINNGVNGSDTWGIGARYKMDNMYVSAGYEVEETDFVTAADREDESWYIEGGFSMGNTMLKAIYGDVERDVTGAAGTDDDTWAIGVDHSLSKRTKVWAQYADSDTGNNNNGQSTINGAAAGSDSAFQIGLQHKF